MSDTQRTRLGVLGPGALRLMALLCGIAAVHGSDAAEPAPEVSTAELSSLLQNGPPLRLVNVLPGILHNERHIPGSVHIPLSALRVSPHMPADKDMLVVFYCMGKLCLYSSRAAGVAREMGYTNLRVYRDGLLGWQQAGLPTASVVQYPKVEVPLVTAAELAARQEVFLMDIRPADHFARGHVPGSANIGLDDLSERIGELPRDRPVALIDHKGKLTLTTGRFLASRGFPAVMRLDGGFNAWVKAGLPVARDPDAPGGEPLPDG
jgi:rhodanese-related sulfurtransferase